MVIALLITGLLFGVLSRFSPLRTAAGTRELYWDIIGWSIFIVGRLVWARVFQPHVDYWAQESPIHILTQGLTVQMPLWACVIVVLILDDFFYYWLHRALHLSLWRFHAWHHSPTHLDWVSGMRTSPVEILLRGLRYAVIVSFFEAAQFGNGLWIIIWTNSIVQHVTHSPLHIPGSRQLEWIFGTPRWHRTHHAAERAISDNNFGFRLTVWDRLFGTFLSPDELPIETMDLGLDNPRSKGELIIGFPLYPRRWNQRGKQDRHESPSLGKKSDQH